MNESNPQFDQLAKTSLEERYNRCLITNNPIDGYSSKEPVNRHTMIEAAREVSDLPMVGIS